MGELGRYLIWYCEYCYIEGKKKKKTTYTLTDPLTCLLIYIWKCKKESIYRKINIIADG